MKPVDFSRLTALDIQINQDLKKYLGFVRHKYNALITGKDRYDMLDILDKDAKKNISEVYKIRLNDDLITKKSGDTLLPLAFSTIHVHGGIATIKAKSKITYSFKAPKELKNGRIYTCSYIFTNKTKSKLLIDLNKSRSFKHAKPISRNQKTLRVAKKTINAIRKAVPEYKRAKDKTTVKLKFILSIGKIMQDLSDFSCASKTQVPEKYIEVKKLIDNKCENQAAVINAIVDLRNTIDEEFKYIPKLKYQKTFDILISVN